jgi:hypothetical protein
MRPEIVQSAPDQVPTIAQSELRGRVDAIEDGRLYGWAWDAAHAQARVAIKIFADDELIAETIADKVRVDLRRNGIGDGAHAFDMVLPNEVRGAALKVVAIHPEGGEDLELHAPSDEQRAVEAVFATPLAPILDRLEAAIIAQRRIQIGHTNSLRELSSATRQLADIAAADGGVARSIQELRDGQQAIAKRLTELEVFMVRFDGLVGEFQRRLAALAKQNSNGVRGHLLVIAGAVGIICGIAVAVAAGL